MDLVSYIEESVEQKRLLNEASEVDLSKEVFESYMKLFTSLSNAFLMMNNSASIDGDGNVSDQLRKAELAIADVKKKMKVVKNSKDKVTLDSGVKKSLGEITNSLKALKDKIEKSIIPSIAPAIEPVADTTEDDPFA